METMNQAAAARADGRAGDGCEVVSRSAVAPHRGSAGEEARGTVFCEDARRRLGVVVVLVIQLIVFGFFLLSGRFVTAWNVYFLLCIIEEH